MVQKPVKAVILLFPITDELAASRKEEDAKVAKGESGPPVDPTLVFIKQTVRPPQRRYLCTQHCLMQKNL
jgi:ubiquitin carboxyl-terminal hydrolase L3